MRRATPFLPVAVFAAAIACSPAPTPEPAPVSSPPPPTASESAAPTATESAAPTGSTPAASAAPKAAAPKPAPCPADAPAPPTKAWGALVQPRGCVVLYNHNLGTPNTDDAISVETYDIRQVAGADVARLRYTRHGEEKEDVSGRDHLPLHVAVTAKGFYVLDPKADDAAITAALKKPPTYTETAKTVKPSKANGYTFVAAVQTPHGPMVCFGYDHPRDNTCEDTCMGEVCVSPTAGVVSLNGTASPSFEHFMQEGFRPK